MHHVYLFLRPCGEPYYVVITSKRNRLNTDHRNELCNRITAKIRAQGLDLRRVILNFDTREEASEWEVYLISSFGRICDNSGTLANMTLGGDGGSLGLVQEKESISRRMMTLDSQPISEAEKQARSLSGLANTNRVNLNPISELQRQSRSLAGVANTGRKHSEEKKSKMGRYVRTPEILASIAATRARNRKK